MVATITSVYPGPRGGAIFSGRDTAGKRLRFVAGYHRICRAPVVGEAWSLAGEIRQHPRYGDQVHVEQASLIQPRGQLIIDFLSKHPAFDVSNLGMYGVREFSAIINPPQATILAIGAARRQAVEQPDGGVAFASMLTATLSCDHRVVDGALGAELLAMIKALIETPVTMLV